MTADELAERKSRLADIAENAWEPEPQSFAFGLPDWSSVTAALRDQFQQLHRALAYLAWVDSPSATTVAKWDGDIHQHWTTPNPTPQARQQHWQSVQRAIALRIQITGLLIAAAQAATSISAAANSPLLLPSAIRSTRALIEELEDYRRLLLLK